MAAVFFERYHDLMCHILDYVPQVEWASIAGVSHSLKRNVREKRARIRKLRFRGSAFGENKDWYEKTANDYPRELLVNKPRFQTLTVMLRHFSTLRRLDLVMCRIWQSDFRAALRSVSETLQDLRIEMICIIRDEPQEVTQEDVMPSLAALLQAPAQPAQPSAQHMVFGAHHPANTTPYVFMNHVALAFGGNVVGMQPYQAPMQTAPPPHYQIAAHAPPPPPQLQPPPLHFEIAPPHPRYPGPTNTTTTASAPSAGSAMEDLIEMKALRRLDLSPPSASVLQGISFPKLMRLSSYRKMLEDKCSNCNIARPSSKCGACKFYAFCTRECQMANWNDNKLGHKRVCHHSSEVDSPQSVSILIWSAARSGHLRELDLAHYWHPNVLFDSTPPQAARQMEDDQEDEDDMDNLLPSPDGVSAVFSRPSAIRVLDRLVSLRLLRCGVDDNALSLIAKNASQLRALDISLNTKVTDVGLLSLARLSSRLEDLRLRQDYRLTDAGIRAALVQLPNLTNLDLRSGIKRLRNRAPHQADQRTIRITSVTSTETLVALNAACPNLKSIRIVANDDQGQSITIIPESMKDKVESDARGGIDVDEWGERDEFYSGEGL